MIEQLQADVSTDEQTQEVAFFGADGSLYAATAPWKRAHGGGHESRVDYTGLALRCMTLAQAERDAASGRPLNGQFAMHLDGVVSQPMFDAAGRIVGALLSKGEIQVISNAAELAALQARVASLTREYGELCYSISHDLNAPLRAVDGFASMLARRAEGHLDDEDKRLLGVIRENGQLMSRMLDKLLILSRINQQQIEPKSTDMRPLVLDAWLDEGGGFAGEFEVGPLPSVWCDRVLFKQVWRELLNNAIKFHRAGTPARITVSGRREENEVVFEVRDNGVGFDNRYASKLFKLFQRLHGPDEFEGIGAGLAIVARVVDRHGGRVWASGEAGAGSVFGLSLPREVPGTGGQAHARPQGGVQ